MFGGMFCQYVIYVYHSKDVRLLVEDMVVWVGKRKKTIEFSIDKSHYFALILQNAI